MCRFTAFLSEFVSHWAPCATEQSSQRVLWRKDGEEAESLRRVIGRHMELELSLRSVLRRKDAREAASLRWYNGGRTCFCGTSLYIHSFSVTSLFHSFLFHSFLFHSFLFHSFCFTAFHSFFPRLADFTFLPKKLFHRLSQLFPKIG